MGESQVPAKREAVPAAKITGPVGGWDTLSNVLAAKQDAIADVLGRAMTPERLTGLAVAAMKDSESAAKILKCTGLSVAKAFMDLATTGLSPAPQLGQCCFVPYGKELQFQIEYRGFIALAKRSGEVSYITADVVREGDAFAYERGTEQYLRHKPEGDGPSTHYYALVRFKDGAKDFRVMTKAQVEKHRDKFSSQFKATKRGPWKDHFDAMAMKTCIRQLCKLLSLSPELVAATMVDEYNEAGVRHTVDMSQAGRQGFRLPRRVEVEVDPPAETPDQTLGDDADIEAAERAAIQDEGAGA